MVKRVPKTSGVMCGMVRDTPTLTWHYGNVTSLCHHMIKLIPSPQTNATVDILKSWQLSCFKLTALNIQNQFIIY